MYMQKDRGCRSIYRTSSYKADEQRNYRQNQQYMDYRACAINKCAQYPAYYQDNCDDIQ